MIRIFILCVFLVFPGMALADTTSLLQQFIAENSAFSPTMRSELDNFYAQRDYRPLWALSDDEATKKTLAFLDSIESLIVYHGLESDNYHLDALRKLTIDKTEPDKLELEAGITAGLLRLAHDLHGDSFTLDALYPGWDFHRQPIVIPTSLSAAIADRKLDDLFNHMAPQNQAYGDLIKTLQTYRTIEAKGNWPSVKTGTALRPHDHDPRVAQLRARLAVENYVVPSPPEGDDFFDDTLNKQLILYQTRNGLSPDGHVGTKTIEALNVPIATRIVQIRANMERWRHMPEDFPPDRYALINIPDFSLTIIEDGKEIYHGLVVDGRDDRPTPFIASKITSMLVNPSWHVPLTIARKDILPKLRKDPHYLEKLSIVIADRNNDPSGTTIDWKHMSDKAFTYQLRQVPGDLNSLGKLKFTFKNSFDVYMHGTPHQELFGKPERDFSSGCVRLQDPARVGEILLEANKDKSGWNQQRISDTIDAGKTLWVPLAKPMPIYILYWSVFTIDGQANFRRDVYGYDLLLIDQMRNVEKETVSPL